MVVELLHQLPFRSNCVERLQQQGSQQPLRRDRWSSFARVKSAEGGRQLPQRLVDQIADCPYRMTRPNTLLQSNVTEKPLRSPIFAAHRSAPSTGDPQCTESPINGITSKPSRKSRFSAAC